MGKSSTGKDTIYNRLLASEELGLKRIVPYTTRPMREGEQQGVEYHFTDEEGFQKLKAAGQPIPFIYMACGTEDDLCGANRAFADFLKEERAEHYYEEGPGKHDWFFWNEYMDRGVGYVLG